MSTNQANIALTVNGDTSQLRSDLKKGGRALESFEDKAKKMQKQIAKVAIASVAAGAAMTAALFQKQAAIIDRLAKTADAIGETTENLQALRHMGELAGVSSEELDKAIQRMAKGLGEAARKGGAAADALDDIGLSVKDVLKLKPNKQMEVLARALATVETQAEKASIASDLFGRNGLRMLKVLKQLESEGLQPTIDSIDAMGASLSRIDAQAVEDANDSLAKAQEAASGLAKELTIALAPVVQAVADAFTNWVKESGGLRNKLEELKPVFNTIINLGKIMVAIYGAQLVAALSRYAVATGSAIFATSVFEKKMVIAQVAAKGMRAATVALSRAMAFLGGPIGLITLAASALYMFASSSSKTVGPADDLNVEVERMVSNFEDMSEAAAKVALIDIEKPIRQAAKAIEGAQKTADAALRRYNQTNDGYIAGMEQFRALMNAGYVDEAIIHGERAQNIKKELPAYEEALNRANLVLEESINKERALLEEKTKLQGIASGRTAKSKESSGIQATMEKKAKDNALLIEQQKKLNQELVEAVDFEALERKERGYHERKHAAQKANNELLIEDHKQTLAIQAQLDEMNAQRARDFVSGTSKMFGDLSSLMGSENKKLFAIGKAAAIAQASIDGIAAAVSSYKFGAAIGGPILGGVFAAASAVSTGAMIKQISSQQIGGGSQKPSAGGGGGSTGGNGGAGNYSQQQQSQPNGTLTVQGLTPDISAIAEQMLEYERNGGRVTLG